MAVERLEALVLTVQLGYPGDDREKILREHCPSPVYWRLKALLLTVQLGYPGDDREEILREQCPSPVHWSSP
jgi:hypothetical protein